MIKLTYYNETLMKSFEIDGIPHADMQGILESVVPEGWGDYSQVLNSGMDLISDLDIKYMNGSWLIPVHSIGCWLYSFALRNKSGNIYETFRVYRRDIETAFRITWAMPVISVMLKECDVPYTEGGDWSAFDVYDIFERFELSPVELEYPGDMNKVYITEYINHVASSTSCGPRGHLLSDQIQYIEALPNGLSILEFIDDELCRFLPTPKGGLDDYLDELNLVVSLAASRFIGEL